MRNIPQQLHVGAEALGLKLNSDVIDKLLSYISLLHKWNQRINLTAINDPVAMVATHILDSLSISNYLVGHNILDVGTGAGLPGIPLALVHPDKQFTLLEANRKKVQFLYHVCHSLTIENIHVVNARVERYNSEHCFDSILTRAFAAMPEMVKLTQHLLCSEGCYLAMKGKIPQSELAALAKEFKIEIYPLHVVGLDAERHLIILKRI